MDEIHNTKKKYEEKKGFQLLPLMSDSVDLIGRKIRIYFRSMHEFKFPRCADNRTGNQHQVSILYTSGYLS